MSNHYKFKICDRDTYTSDIKTINGRELILVAVQKSRRTWRKGRTKYVYNLEGTSTIYYNRSKDGILFYPICQRPHLMPRYFDIFVRDGQTHEETVWLNRYDYKIVK